MSKGERLDLGAVLTWEEISLAAHAWSSPDDAYRSVIRAAQKKAGLDGRAIRLTWCETLHTYPCHSIRDSHDHPPATLYISDPAPKPSAEERIERALKVVDKDPRHFEYCCAQKMARILRGED